MADNRPIGFMDSGLGGVTVLKEAVLHMPQESFIFYGDNAHAPYGSKTRDEICRYAFASAEALVELDVKALVIACNTATSAAIDDIRAAFPIPVISMEPAIKPALEQTDGRVLMLATPMTCTLSRYQKLKSRLDPDGRVEDVPCYDWVECIEAHLMEKNACKDVVENILRRYDGQQIGAIVLGCTHFSLLKDMISAYAEEHFRGSHTLYDGNLGTVLHLIEVLRENDAMADGSEKKPMRLLSSGEDKYISAMKAVLADGDDAFGEDSRKI